MKLFQKFDERIENIIEKTVKRASAAVMEQNKTQWEGTLQKITEGMEAQTRKINTVEERVDNAINGLRKEMDNVKVLQTKETGKIWKYLEDMKGTVEGKETQQAMKAAQEIKDSLKKLEKERKQIEEQVKKGGESKFNEEDLKQLKGEFMNELQVREDKAVAMKGVVFGWGALPREERVKLFKK